VRGTGDVRLAYGFPFINPNLIQRPGGEEIPTPRFYSSIKEHGADSQFKSGVSTVEMDRLW